ncbi:Protein of unknown function, partial [Gryllus bimaculatus]
MMNPNTAMGNRHYICSVHSVHRERQSKQEIEDVGEERESTQDLSGAYKTSDLQAKLIRIICEVGFMRVKITSQKQ